MNKTVRRIRKNPRKSKRIKYTVSWEDYVKENKEKLILRRLRDWKKLKINLTWDEYLHLLEKQNHKCLLCGKEIYTFSFKGKLTAIPDHSHKSGKVRGLLCNGCNFLVGILERENIDTNRLLNYISDLAEE